MHITKLSVFTVKHGTHFIERVWRFVNMIKAHIQYNVHCCSLSERTSCTRGICRFQLHSSCIWTVLIWYEPRNEVRQKLSDYVFTISLSLYSQTEMCHVINWLTKLLLLRTASMIPAINAAQFKLDCRPVNTYTPPEKWHCTKTPIS